MIGMVNSFVSKVVNTVKAPFVVKTIKKAKKSKKK